MSFLSLQKEIGTDVNLDRDSGSIVSTLIGIEQDKKNRVRDTEYCFDVSTFSIT